VLTSRQKVQQLVILSGKGGTGKTSISASLMHLSASSKHQAVFVDADVDAANLALVSQAQPISSHSYWGSHIADIDPQECNLCDVCYEVCRYDAIIRPVTHTEKYQVSHLLCDGCAACVYQCPQFAIQMVKQEDGEWFHSETPYGNLFHAELFPAAENTGKLVTTVKQNAKLFAEDHQIPLMIIDGPPGIGCPAISASAGADLALLVAEPGVSGYHDLERIISTLSHFKVPAMICINKADLDLQTTQEIHQLARSQNFQVAAEIPFDNAFPKAMVQGLPITEFAPVSIASGKLRQMWDHIQDLLFGEKNETSRV
jgi:MinD superfamily P-loop ATPase